MPNLQSVDAALAWAREALKTRNTLRSEDAQMLEPAFTQSSAAPLLVSIIVPCFNYGHFVVSSALRQTISSLEVIADDDGSGDSETIKVLETLKTLPHVGVIRLSQSGPWMLLPAVPIDATWLIRWDAAGCPPMGKRPGEGRSDGSNTTRTVKPWSMDS